MSNMDARPTGGVSMSILKDLTIKGAVVNEGGDITAFLNRMTKEDLAKLSQELFMTHMNVAAYLCPKNVMRWERIKK